MPWNWDLDNYFGDKDKDWMRHEQLFYPEDILTIIVVQAWEVNLENRRIAERNAETEKQQQEAQGRRPGSPFNPGMFQSLGRR